MAEKSKISEDQIRYGSVLNLLLNIGFIFLSIGFVIYVSNVLPNVVPLSKVVENWDLRANQYVKNTHTPIGIDWLYFLDHGDIISFAGIGFLALITLLCFISVFPVYVKNRQWILVAIVFVQILVFLFAIFFE